MNQKKQKTKVIRGFGNINISNVGSASSECITDTYTVTHCQNLETATKIQKQFDKILTENNEEKGPVTVEISDYNTKESDVKLKYKVKTCESDQKARDVKKAFDEYIRKIGGQTTLTEEFDQEAQENSN